MASNSVVHDHALNDEEQEFLRLWRLLDAGSKGEVFFPLSKAAPVSFFTRWHRLMDDGGLTLVVESATGHIAECVELDVRELPGRPELLARLAPKARARLLGDAAELARAAA